MVKSRKFFLSVVLAIMAMLCFCFGAQSFKGVAEQRSTVQLSIQGTNLSLRDNVHIKYAVEAKDVYEGDTLELLVWLSPQENYDKGTESEALISKDSVTNNGKTYKVFAYEKLSAKQMTEKVYARAYAVVDGEEFYSAVKPYSILEYAYDQLGKTEAKSTAGEKLVNLLNAMLEYGGAAQIYHDYNLDNLANDDYAYVRIQNATFADGFNYGLYKVGESVVITPNDGYKLAENHADYFSVGQNGKIILTVPSEKTIDTTSFVQETQDNGLQFVLINGDTEYEVSGYNGTATEVVIPATYNGKPVTSIGNRAFENYSSLINIEIPESVTSIGYRAFRDCNLKSVTFGENSNLQSIGGSAFYSCTSLTSISFGENSKLQSIGAIAFYNCSSLTSIEIPDSVTSISSGAFDQCNDALYTIENHIKYIKANGNIYHILDRATNTTLSSYEINSQTAYIAESAFGSCSRLSSITIPESVTSIGGSAFYNCSSLTSVKILDGVKSIGNGAFYDCSSLTSVVIPSSVKDIGESVFYNTSLTSVYYGGTAEDWEGISIDTNNNEYLINATRYYYYENESDVPTDGGNYWHYVDGEVTVWETQSHTHNNVNGNCSVCGIKVYTVKFQLTTEVVLGIADGVKEIAIVNCDVLSGGDLGLSEETTIDEITLIVAEGQTLADLGISVLPSVTPINEGLNEYEFSGYWGYSYAKGKIKDVNADTVFNDENITAVSEDGIVILVPHCTSLWFSA